jgi:calcium-dependent protein kinase
MSNAPASTSIQGARPHEDFKVESGRFAGLKPGRIQDHYKIGRKLGAGAYGFVREAVHKKSGHRRAIKTVQKDSISRDLTEKFKFFSEVDVLAGLDHPNIVKLYEFYEDDKYFHLVTEYIGGGELFDYIIKSKLLSEPIAAHFMKQILSGVAFCHSNNIVHRDIKPENLLLDKESAEASLKIIDFGTSANISERLTQKYGTAYYIAPEVLKEDYDEKCDVWSCGVILYILLSGKPPFYGRGDKEIISRVEKGEYSLRGPGWEMLSMASRNFIKRLLEFNPKKRLSAQQALEDEWIGRFTSSSIIQSPPISLENLVAFRSGQKLQKAIMTFIASQFLTKEETSTLAVTFRKLDKNNDGKLSKEELLEAFIVIHGAESAEEEVLKVFEEADVNQSGFIDYSEFLLAMTQKEILLSSENLEKSFSVFDQDNSGKISVAELKEILGAAVNSGNSNWEELIREVDSNGDGELDLVEFKEMMSRVSKFS